MQFLWMILTGLIFSSCGFYMYIYFFSIGYGFSIAACGAVMALLFRSSLTAGTALQCLLLIVYGIRLGGYLLVREMKSAAYRKVLSPEMTRSKKMGMGPKIAIWISCALLYALEVSRSSSACRTVAAPILTSSPVSCSWSAESAWRPPPRRS